MAIESPTAKWTAPHGNFSRWDILDTPMWVDFGDPTINHIKDNESSAYLNNPEKALIAENYGENDWVYLIISVGNSTNPVAENHRRFIAAAHPIHLHGHDFVLLAQQNRSFNPQDVDTVFKYDNPPRRDVVLLPLGGYIAIGFKTDNPGVWIIHCHIAWHASSGLAMQIHERGPDIKLDPGFVKEKDTVCADWKSWHDNKTNWWNPTEFQEDSGV